MKSRLLLAAALALILAAPAAASHSLLTMDDVIRLSREGVSASVIVAEIETSRSVFDLSTEDILILTDEGVPQSVIEAMIRTSENAGGYENYEESGDEAGDYSTGYGDGYRSGSDLRYRYSFAISLGYYDPWYYYYPWSAYYAACYPYYRINYWYRPFYVYDPWYYSGHHYWYRSYPSEHVRVATGGRHSWGRRGSSWGSGSPSYVNNRTQGRSLYTRGPGALPRGTTTRKPPVYKPPRNDGRRDATPRPSWQRERPNTRGQTETRKPAAPPPSTRSRGDNGNSRGGGSNDSGRHYGGRSGGGHSR
jgi:uncharacterized membrane protein YgcG